MDVEGASVLRENRGLPTHSCTDETRASKVLEMLLLVATQEDKQGYVRMHHSHHTITLLQPVLVVKQAVSPEFTQGAQINHGQDDVHGLSHMQQGCSLFYPNCNSDHNSTAWVLHML